MMTWITMSNCENHKNHENHENHKNHENHENHENHKNHQEGERDTEWTNIIPTMEKRKSRLRYESADSR